MSYVRQAVATAMIVLVLVIIAGLVLIGIAWQWLDTRAGRRLVDRDERARHTRLMAELRRHRDDP